MFEQISQNISLRDRIVQDILSKIESGELVAGDKLPTERDLSVQLNVSRTTVRDALRTLAGLGMISIQHGRGIFVQGTEGTALGNALWAPFVVRSDTVAALFEVRKALESAAAEWAAARASDEELALLAQLTNEATEVVAANGVDFEAAADADQAFHTALVAVSHNPIAGRMMLNLLDLLDTVRKQSLAIPGRAQQSVHDHKEITEAIQSRDPERARRAVLHHLSGVEAAILENLE